MSGIESFMLEVGVEHMLKSWTQHFKDDIEKCIFLKKNAVSQIPVDNKSALIMVMALH